MSTILRIIISTGVLFLSTQISLAQVTPIEHSQLNHRIIGFSFPTKQGTSNCNIEIAQGDYNSEDYFSKKIIKTTHVTGNKVIDEVPSFGRNYT